VLDPLVVGHRDVGERVPEVRVGESDSQNDTARRRDPPGELADAPLLLGGQDTIAVVVDGAL
jgi:hypothetical protein